MENSKQTTHDIEDYIAEEIDSKMFSIEGDEVHQPQKVRKHTNNMHKTISSNTNQNMMNTGSFSEGGGDESAYLDEKVKNIGLRLNNVEEQLKFLS